MNNEIYFKDSKQWNESKFEIVNVKENMSTHQRLDDITVKVKEIRQLTGVRWDKKQTLKLTE